MPKFRNPVIPGSHPDPSVCRVGADYYLACSSFEFFPGVPLFHSRDLVNWRPIGHALTRDSQLDLHGCKSSLGIFAPTLRHIGGTGGRFVLISTNLNKFKNFFVWAEQPAGPWSEPVWLDWPGIDPSLFEDADGRVYISGNGGFMGDEALGIYQAEIDLQTGALLSPRRLIWTGTGGKAPEGPHLVRRQGFYYLLIAEGGTEYGHMVTVARSATPFGPFEACPANPILSHRSLDSPIQATGHADLVETADGTWWAVFLGIRPAPVRFAGLHHHLGRETFLAPVSWTAEGWPRIGPVTEAMDAGSLPLQTAPVVPVRTEFTAADLPHEFNHLRNPQPGSWSLQTRPGWLSLIGQADTLDDPAAPAFVGRRQQHFDCKVSTLLDFEPLVDGEEAGLTVFKNERFHYEIAVGRRAGERVVFLRRRIGSLWKVEREQPLPAGELVLGLRADAQHFRFFFKQPGAEPQDFGSGECALLSTEVAGGFTGVYLGLYASGNGRLSTAVAHFKWLDYEPT